MHPVPFSVLLLILHGPHLIPSIFHLNTIHNLPINHFNYMLPHNLSGIHHPKGGGPHKTNLQSYHLHLYINHMSFTLLHLSNLRYLLNQIRT